MRFPSSLAEIRQNLNYKSSFPCSCFFAKIILGAYCVISMDLWCWFRNIHSGVLEAPVLALSHYIWVPTWAQLIQKKTPSHIVIYVTLLWGNNTWNHYAKKSAEYQFIARFIVNRVLTDKIYQLIYRWHRFSIDFRSDRRYFGRVSVKFHWNLVWQSIFLSYSLAKLCISSNFPFILISTQGIKVILLFNAPNFFVHS
jgi:hypothetical protein